MLPEASGCASDAIIGVPAEALAEGELKLVEVGSLRICLARVDGTYHAVDDVCSHATAYLHEGDLVGCEVECPWHGARFDLRTGAPTLGPASRAIGTYAVETSAYGVLVRVPAGALTQPPTA